MTKNYQQYNAKYIEGTPDDGDYSLQPVAIFNNKRFWCKDIDGDRTSFGSITYNSAKESFDIKFDDAVFSFKDAFAKCCDLQNQLPADITDLKSWCKTLYNLVEKSPDPKINSYAQKTVIEKLQDALYNNYLEAAIVLQSEGNDYMLNGIKNEVDSLTYIFRKPTLADKLITLAETCKSVITDHSEFVNEMFNQLQSIESQY